MKILIIQVESADNLVTGEDVVIKNDIKYLQKSGIDFNYERIKIPRLQWSSIISILGGLTWSFSNYKKVKSIIHNYNPDLVHFHTIVPYLSYSVIKAVNNSNTPLVQTLHNGRWICLEGGFFRNDTYCDDCVGSFGWLGVKRGCGHGKIISFFLFFVNFVIRKFELLFQDVSRFIAVSNFVRDQHVNSGFPKDSIIVRNNGFDIATQVNIDESWLHRNGIVYAGRLSIAKGSKVLKYIIKNLNCKISIVGNGPESLVHYQQYLSYLSLIHISEPTRPY